MDLGCIGCNVNGLCLPSGSQWFDTNQGCSRKCICFKPSGSAEHVQYCGNCPTPTLAAGGSAGAPATQVNKGKPGALDEIDEEDGGGLLFTEAEIAEAERAIVENEPLQDPVP